MIKRTDDGRTYVHGYEVSQPQGCTDKSITVSTIDIITLRRNEVASTAENEEGLLNKANKQLGMIKHECESAESIPLKDKMHSVDEILNETRGKVLKYVFNILTTYRLEQKHQRLNEQTKDLSKQIKKVEGETKELVKYDMRLSRQYLLLSREKQQHKQLSWEYQQLDQQTGQLEQEMQQSAQRVQQLKQLKQQLEQQHKQLRRQKKQLDEEIDEKAPDEEFKRGPAVELEKLWINELTNIYNYIENHMGNHMVDLMSPSSIIALKNLNRTMITRRLQDLKLKRQAPQEYERMISRESSRTNQPEQLFWHG